MSNNNLEDGVEVILSCYECEKKLEVLLPVFNKSTTADFIWQAIIDNGWIAIGDEDLLFCPSCRNE